ncbi:MAG: MFS transporter [Rhodospirillaceae bacterium]|nr:MFS transporter [Rhodospirillaceae bacterium]
MWILITCTLVTTLYGTNLTIANVSLPQIQGALSASPDQISWVVTSNLIATAVTIPLAGWIANRFGRRRSMIWGVTGFAIATLMCGLSASLTELILWRVLQSAFCSPLAAIAQSVVIDEFTGERRAKATSIYMMGVGIPATVAPIISGYVCEELSWSWVFFILVPVAFLALFGLLKSIKPDPPSPRNITLDWIGFISLAITIACIQLVLDRGEREEWLSSGEILLECFLIIIFGWIFFSHSLTAKLPLFDLRLFLERNFTLGIGIHCIFGMLFVTPMVLIPSMLQQLTEVPDFTVGILISLRFIATAIAMLIMVFFASQWHPKFLLLLGFGLHTYAGIQMATFDMNTSILEMAWALSITGLGVGFLWVPMTIVTFSNLDPKRSVEGAMMWNFMRSIGSSFYISLSFIVIFHTQKINYADLVQWINPYINHLKSNFLANGQTSLIGAVEEISRQSTNIGYINVFNFFLWTSLLAYPLIMLISWPPQKRGQ